MIPIEVVTLGYNNIDIPAKYLPRFIYIRVNICSESNNSQPFYCTLSYVTLL